MASEYLIIPVTTNLSEECLETLSLDGWELVCVSDNKRLSKTDYYFRRLENTNYVYDKKMWKLVFQTYEEVSIEKFNIFIKDFKEKLKNE